VKIEKKKWKWKEKNGFLFKSSSVGGSVAKAKAAIVSMIKLTHNNCTAVKTLSPLPSVTALMKANVTAV